MNVQIPCAKWHRSMHTVSPSHPQTPDCRSKTVLVFIEKKKPRIREPAQFKPVLLKGQLFFEHGPIYVVLIQKEVN